MVLLSMLSYTVLSLPFPILAVSTLIHGKRQRSAADTSMQRTILAILIQFGRMQTHI
ncbi:hypothetical protein T440DRAFT_466976 [Plenodomus tracheiphilus IPT5]|uniref:Uncharacterized protein n=1 Tax=Plenodomus tracheiphilus IPT5 TaxID=1408161 RepID=A0A6A7BA99_9PLEO|nr:hypothetical protein T440DRAFT_466976 [Plenodomus tracheiphilus IPT5]